MASVVHGRDGDTEPLSVPNPGRWMQGTGMGVGAAGSGRCWRRGGEAPLRKGRK